MRANSQGVHFLVLAQILTAISIVSAKYLLNAVPLSILVITRFLLAGLMLFIIHILSHESKKSLREYNASLASKDYLFLFLQALCGGALFNIFMYLGLEYTDANVAGIITSALPAIIALMAALILKEKITRKKLTSIVYATLGLLIISLDKIKSGPVNASLLGNILVFLALMPEAFYYILCKLHPNRLPPFLASSIINLFNALICTFSLFFISLPPFHVSLKNGSILVFTALASGLFYAFWFLGSKRVDGVLSSLITAVMPLSTVLFAWIFLHESLSALECAGMGLVLFSLVLYSKR